jgi:hypothetical protein
MKSVAEQLYDGDQFFDVVNLELPAIRWRCAERPMEHPVLRLKMVVNSLKRHADQSGNVTQEELQLSAVYGAEGNKANEQWSKWTPSGSLQFTISNPSAFSKVMPGQFVFVDLTITDKDGI